MKKLTQKLALLLLSITFLITVSSISTAFAADKEMGITLRIEGIEQNLFYETVSVPYTDTLTLQKALTYIDTQEDSIKLTGVDTAYITDINGETAGKFGGWDGWLFKINGKDAAVGIDSLELVDGDSVVLFYGDPFGVGMQFPVADTSKIDDGKLTFTSSDTTYDANYNASVTVNPVVGATVIWSSNDKTTEYVTDKNGTITIDADQLTAGAHAVQVSKVGDTKLPLVLRLAPDYTISVKADSTTTTTTTGDTTTKITDNATDTTDSADTTDATNEAAPTGENYATALVLFIFAAASLLGVIILSRKAKNENK